ncbi:esterase/lipase family protein [Dolichospermum circinale]|uniref:esterase/lipase family protein n=1 Tax=Dolichospermum circinale TaxID=109265 RepID=UPI00232B7763|nr:lecithin--cholesterol acyltransferase [Dolichospermum circinale]MDB9466152.1 lecithin--cholesterol acyltransferase [Dolichospermum circinale CS-539/09]MDB9471719.1 lecithin--cholesterol acyltransferase [Dolichospermum circinale CS-539]
MAKEMKDIIVLIPGIMGSILQLRNGRNLWDTGNIIWAMTGLNNDNLQRLRMQGDDYLIDDLEDGVQATGLIRVPGVIGGLIKTDDYSSISNLITEEFNVTKGEIHDNNPANFFEFPYDWRRDNRVAARKLQQLIDKRLPQWREKTGNEKAKVIILAHSMGGLVARHYLEVLEGWQNCRALVTFGTPYRGAVNSVNYLANEQRLGFADLTDIVRSFTSVYQLMPIYPMVKIGENYQRVSETQGIPHLDKKRAEKALAFHREIEQAVEKHQKDAQYLNFKDSYQIIPFVGCSQNTFQSVELVDGKIQTSYELPTINNQKLDIALAEGDGTVPRLSASPIELDGKLAARYIVDTHSCLQSNLQVFDDLSRLLEDMQNTENPPIRGGLRSELNHRATISLNIDDLYVTSEPIELRAKILNLNTNIGVLQATITPVEANKEPIQLNFKQQDEQWVLTIDKLSLGLYRLEVETSMKNPLCPTPVKDVFVVI